LSLQEESSARLSNDESRNPGHLLALLWGLIEGLGRDPPKEACLSPELGLRTLSELNLLCRRGRALYALSGKSLFNLRKCLLESSQLSNMRN
jgi:hypothetical protein